MNDAQHKALIRQTFDTVAPGYDRPALRFFHDSAARMAGQLRLTGGERVLDVATGTGAVALALAECLPAGHVIGIDLSEGMLRQARRKAYALGLTNVDFQAMDITALDLPEARFHCATAAFSLFFVQDMEACLRGIVRRLRPGGRMLACGFSGTSFLPNADLFLARIEQYGVAIPPMSWKRLADESLNRTLFAAAGLEDIQVVRHDLGYRLPHAEAWWEVLWHAGFRGLLDQLDEQALARFREEHLAEIAALDDGGGVPLHVEVLYTEGRRPARG